MTLASRRTIIRPVTTDPTGRNADGKVTCIDTDTGIDIDIDAGTDTDIGTDIDIDIDIDSDNNCGLAT